MNALTIAWISITGITLVLTILAYIEARGDRKVVSRTGATRDVQTGATLRREALRVLVQALLLSVALPSLVYVPGAPRPPLVSSFTIGALMAIPIILMVSSILDARDRRKLTILVATGVVAQRDELLERISAQLAHNIEITQEKATRVEAKVDDIHHATVEKEKS